MNFGGAEHVQYPAAVYTICKKLEEIETSQTNDVGHPVWVWNFYVFIYSKIPIQYLNTVEFLFEMTSVSSVIRFDYV